MRLTQYFFFAVALSRHQGRVRTEQGNLLPPNTLSASYYFQLREFPEFDVVCLLVTLKGSLFQVFVQSPLELLTTSRLVLAPLGLNVSYLISSNCGPAESGEGEERGGKILKRNCFQVLTAVLLFLA